MRDGDQRLVSLIDSKECSGGSPTGKRAHSGGDSRIQAPSKDTDGHRRIIVKSVCPASKQVRQTEAPRAKFSPPSTVDLQREGNHVGLSTSMVFQPPNLTRSTEVVEHPVFICPCSFRRRLIPGTSPRLFPQPPRPPPWPQPEQAPRMCHHRPSGCG